VVVYYFKIINNRNNLMIEIESSINGAPKEGSVEKPEKKSNKGFSSKNYESNTIETAELKEFEEQSEDFNIPAELKDEIMDLVKTGELLGEDEAFDEIEIKESLLEEGDVGKIESCSRDENLGAGFNVAEEDYVSMINSCLPEVNDTEQARDLKSSALTQIGYSALEAHDYVAAEEAFYAVITHYKNTETALIVSLEMTKLMIDQSRFDEAQSVLNEVSDLPGEDSDFGEMVSELQGIIDRKQ
ncbi:MAG: tetratricopeptide repeat protein, partial [Candidatus Omnitrophota bacterium]